MKSNSKIQDKISKWLSEEDLHFVEVPDSEARFHFVVDYPDKENDMHILHPNSKIDGVIILSGAFVESEHVSKMEKLSVREREEFIFNLREKLNNFSTEFYLDQKEAILYQFVITYLIFNDGLTKDHFFRALGWVLKSKLLGIWEIQRRFGKSES
jgi:hypothetical protein